MTIEGAYRSTKGNVQEVLFISCVHVMRDIESKRPVLFIINKHTQTKKWKVSSPRLTLTLSLNNKQCNEDYQLFIKRVLPTVPWSVTERSVTGPYIVFSSWKRSSSCRNRHRTCLSRVSRIGDTVPDGLET